MESVAESSTDLIRTFSGSTSNPPILRTNAARPRVLIIGLRPEEVEEIKPLAGSVTEARSVNDVHAEEHDVLIHVRADFNDASWSVPRRIAFAEPAKPASEKPRFPSSSGGSGGNGFRPSTKSYTQFKPARDVDILEEARGRGLAGLVERSCVPAPGATYTGFALPVHPKRVEIPLLRERLANGLCLAGILESTDDTSESESVFWLPDIARSCLADWVRVAFAHWRAQNPDAFPETAEWHASDAWSAPAELDARAHLRAFDAEETARAAQAADRRRQLVNQLDSVGAAGESWRSLISSTGDELVEAVKVTLEGFGFAVLDADALQEHKGKKREDLRVSDGDWVALVEVKGYVGAAKSNDLQQLSSAAIAYAAAEGRAPDALWYVVNSFRNDDPSQRPRALDNRDDDLDGFAEHHGGGLIDTRDLFALRQNVVLSRVSGDDARALLKAMTGRFVVRNEK